MTELTVTEPLPAGSLVRDEFRGPEYSGKPDWSPAGPEREWKRVFVDPAK